MKEVMCDQGIEEYSQEETLEEGICEGRKEGKEGNLYLAKYT